VEPLTTAFALYLHRSQVAVIRRHAALAYPEECCGVLVGTPAPDGARVQTVLEAANVAPRRQRRYSIDPVSLLFAHRQARDAGRQVVGYYHSHPDTPAFPSERDLAEAWPGVIYLIVEVMAGAVVALRGWRLGGDGQGFEEVVLPGVLVEGVS
jgi:proteasome lid subunit RPN8/RPN11